MVAPSRRLSAQTDRRAAFLKLIDRKRVPLAAETRVRPAVIVLHGMGVRKEEQLAVLRTLADRGLTGVAIDARYHGERAKTDQGTGEYIGALLQAYRSRVGYPYMYDAVWDTMRPLLVINGDSDPQTPLPGVLECMSAAGRAYAAAGAQDKLGLYLQPNLGHVFTPSAELVALDWFVRWLSP